MPATHRLRASCSAKPPPLPVSSALQGPRARMGHRWVAETRQLHTRKVPRRNKTLPARAARPHFRYKTLPARPKWPNSALILHAGRVLYRSHRQEAKQGEFYTEHEAELGLATTAQHAPCGRRQETTAPGRGAGFGRLVGPARVGGATARQISHIISHGHFSRPPENVAIPTIQIQCLNKLQGNYVRNCYGAGRRQEPAGRRADTPSEARRADGTRAGRRPPAHTAARTN